MSRIYFHSQHGEAEVSGRERHYANHLCRDLLAISLEIDSTFVADDHYHALTPFLPDYLKKPGGSKQLNAIKTWIAVSGGISDENLHMPSGDVSAFALSLNTALVMGSDPIKLLARLHGQCEIHAYVEGKNRAWLASIIEQGLEIGVMRPDAHWEDAVTLLRARDDSPVVTSYSVTEQFPSRHTAGWNPTRNNEYGEPDYDEWYELSADERWRLALEGLRATSNRELKPEDWATYYFDGGETGFSVMDVARELESKSR